MDYVDRIKDLRVDADLPQKEVATLLHVAQKTYSDYELRKTRIPVDRLIQLAAFYNVDMNYICALTNIPNKYPGEGNG